MNMGKDSIYLLQAFVSGLLSLFTKKTKAKAKTNTKAKTKNDKEGESMNNL